MSEFDPLSYFYEYKEDQSQVQKELQCAICMHTLVEPCTVSCCQQMFCYDCMKYNLSTPDCKGECPMCKKQLELTNKENLYDNYGKITKSARYVNFILNNLIVTCEVCHTEMPRGNFQNHKLNECEIKCNQCEMMIKPKNNIHHLANECEKRQVNCCPFIMLKEAVTFLNQQNIDTEKCAILCDWTGLANELINHRSNCLTYQQLLPVFPLLTYCEPRVEKMDNLDIWHTNRYGKDGMKSRSTFERYLKGSCVILIDVQDPKGKRKWRHGEVIGRDRHNNKAHIHYIGWTNNHNEWIAFNSNRLQPLYTHTTPTPTPFTRHLKKLRPVKEPVIIIPELPIVAINLAHLAIPDISGDEALARRLEAEINNENPNQNVAIEAEVDSDNEEKNEED